MKNYFSVFSIKPTLHLDCKQLRVKYMRLQALCNEDKSLDATFVNEAYGTLKGAYQRTLHFLALSGWIHNEHENCHDTTLLMEQMSIRESIETIKNNNELEPLKQKINKRIDGIQSSIEALYKQNELEEIRPLLVHWRFLEKALERAQHIKAQVV